MRWWDNHGWTEHTTEARAPIVIQEAKLAWADDDLQEELPTRRERRERERNDTVSGDIDSDEPVADPLLELEPPSWDEVPADEPAPESILTPKFEPIFEPVADTVTSPVVDATSVAGTMFDGAAFGATTQTSPQADAQQAAAAASAQPAATVPPVEPVAPAQTAAPAASAAAPSPNTAGAWVIALLPLAQLVATLLIVAAAGSAGSNIAVIGSILAAPYLISIPFAIADRRALRRNGYPNPASWLWVFLGGPIYLIARAIRIVMRAGNGFGPILVWCALVLLQVGSIVAVPGLVISALPQTFSAEAAQSIQHDATVFGPITTVKCPTPPATVMGQQFTCTLYRVGSGQSYKVTASLQRENGWIAWRVDDWGSYNVNR
jgi:hypothetical protein